MNARRHPLRRAERGTSVPLAPAQERLWFLDRLQGSSLEYSVVQAVRLHGPLNQPALSRALTALVVRHESLRTRFAEVDGQPMQVVDPPAAVTLPVEDLKGLDAAAQETRMREVLRREQATPFDVRPPARPRVQ